MRTALDDAGSGVSAVASLASSLIQAPLQLRHALMELFQSARWGRSIPLRRRRHALLHAPAAIGPVQHRPDPQKRPKNVEREEAHPTGSVDRVLVRVIAMLREFVRHVMDRDNAVEERDEHKNEEAEGEVVQERVEVDVTGDKKGDAHEKDDDEDGRGDHPLADPEAGFTKAEDTVPALAPNALGGVSGAAPKSPDGVSAGARCFFNVVQGHDAISLKMDGKPGLRVRASGSVFTRSISLSLIDA